VFYSRNSIERSVPTVSVPQPPNLKPVNDHKLSHFTQGSVRKSKKDREKEDEERKAREEEEKAAQVLAEFVDAFESEGPKRTKTGGGFVRAGAGVSYNPASRSGMAPPKGPAAMLQQEPVGKQCAKEYRDLMYVQESTSNVPRPKGKRAMDAFLDEIKRLVYLRQDLFML
jgi:U2-associated protein SR140